MSTSKHADPRTPFTRRDLLLAAAGGVAVLGAASAGRAVETPAAAPTGPFTLPPLPYADNALDPVISANTLGFHHGKHHQAYLDNLNKAVTGTPYADMPLEKIIAATFGLADKGAVFNNAAQH